MADTTGSRDTATPSPPATTDLASLLKITPKISKKLANEDDYPAWRIEAERQIWRMKLTDAVTGSETDEPATGIDMWKDKTYKVLDYIMDSCEQEPQLKIRAAATAAEAWTILNENYEGKGAPIYHTCSIALQVPDSMTARPPSKPILKPSRKHGCLWLKR